MKFRVSEPMYNTTLHVYWGDDRFWKEANVPEEEGKDSNAMFAVNTRFFIWVKPSEDKIQTLGRLSHELIHFTHEAARWIGFGSHEDAEEFYTYYHQYFLEKIAKKVKLFDERKVVVEVSTKK